jgi:hypothetical protein
MQDNHFFVTPITDINKTIDRIVEFVALFFEKNICYKLCSTFYENFIFATTCVTKYFKNLFCYSMF